MAKYIAFLRAINIGKRIVKMDRLKKIFEELKFKYVKTFINSGNVIFETDEKDKELIKIKLEKKLKDSLGFEILIMLRDEKELIKIADQNPFKNEELDKDTRIYIAFLYRKSNNEMKSIISTFNNQNESFVLKNNNVYCMVHKDEKKDSYYSITFLEKKLGVPLTIRNQNTVNKIKILL